MKKKLLMILSIVIVLVSMLISCTSSKDKTDTQESTITGNTEEYIEGEVDFGNEEENSDSTIRDNEKDDFDVTIGNMEPNDNSSDSNEKPSLNVPTTIKEYVVVNNGTTRVVTTSVYVTTTKPTTTKRGITTTTTENPNDLEPDFN